MIFRGSRSICRDVPKKPEIRLDEHGFPPTIPTEALCHVTGIATRRLNQLVTDRRIPAECRAGSGDWFTTKSLIEIFGYYRRQADQGKPKEGRGIEAQIAIEDLRKLRLANAKTSRELLPRRVYVEAWGELLTTFKNRWMSFGSKMGPRVFRAKDKVEAAEILEREISDIFLGLNDPKVMDDIEAKIRDDEFNADPGSKHDSAPGD